MASETATSMPLTAEGANEQSDEGFSNLEAAFAQTKVERRPNSVEMKAVWHHTAKEDKEETELDFDCVFDSQHGQFQSLPSLQSLFPAVVHRHHLIKGSNFAAETSIRCYDFTPRHGAMVDLDDLRLRRLLQGIAPRTDPLPIAEHGRVKFDCQRLLVFFVTLEPTKDTSFASRVSLTQESTTALFDHLDLNPSYLLNLIGRPDYWSPQMRWELDEEGRLKACDFFCQQPRWNLQIQGAPLSTYMRYDVELRLTTYIISHKHNDSTVNMLQKLLHNATNVTGRPGEESICLQDPFDIAVMLSTLSFEASKHHVTRFRRYMWQCVNNVDDNLIAEAADRERLGHLTKDLQILSQQADSHLLNADVAIISATSIRDAQDRLQRLTDASPAAFQYASDAISYVIQSMEKQKKLFLNYKNRKDGTMNLVYNLVTQQDAATNMQLAASMKRDSTSMNGIAALTMVFLPGTFTAAVLSAGIFSAVAQSSSIAVSGIWWLWVAITLPLTGAVLASWYVYKFAKSKEERNKKMKAAAKEQADAKVKGGLDSRRPSGLGRHLSLAGLSLFRTRDSNLETEV